MNTQKLLSKAAKEILEAYKAGHVSAAATAAYPYRAFNASLRSLLSEIPTIFLNRILR